MRVASDRAALAEARRKLTGRVAVVMTMGALHAGHAALLAAARERADHLICTIFVNPLQFGPNEDLDRYPRTLDADLAVCAEHGVDLVLAPTLEVVYPCGDPLVRVNPGPLGEILEGASRPGFFHGVLTVVMKLLQLTRPDAAYFGEKDYQQLTLVRRMVRDLDVPTEIIGVPTVREPDGLALSSRNAYFSAAERETALALSRALRAGRSAAVGGAAAALASARATLASAAFALHTETKQEGSASPATSSQQEGDALPAASPQRALSDGVQSKGGVLDYLALTDPELGPPPERGEARLLVAATVGTTRLIDNVAIELGGAATAGSLVRGDVTA